jgi:predicted PurR-regulated permease PerM
VRGALDQIRSPERRQRAEVVADNAYRRAVRYVLSTVLLAVAAGLFGYLVASLADVPGAAALGLWVALWDVVPLFGALVGALPIVLLAAVFFSAERAVVAAIAFLAWQTFEYVAVQRRIERRSIHLGPFVTLFTGLAGLELYGLGGGLLAVVVAAAAIATADELLPA